MQIDVRWVRHRFPDNDACLEFLETFRWGDEPQCPQCASTNVARKADGHRRGRWNCYSCTNSFVVLSGTVMNKTRMPLPQWFVLTAALMNGEQLSSCEIGKRMRLTQKTAWYMKDRIYEAITEANRDADSIRAYPVTALRQMAHSHRGERS